MNQALRVSRLLFASRLSIWISISALLISPASAQVNGPGPSPSSDFDVVVNLPDDQFSFNDEIGGVAGETVQVNVLSGGRVDSPRANFGSELNLDGGTLGMPFSAENGSEVNVISGRVGFFDDNVFEIHTGSEVNISGGEIDGNIFALSSSSVNVSGGELNGSFDAFFGSLVNISGGSFGSTFGFDPRSFNAFAGSEVNISGGDFSEGFDANFGSVVNISGGSFSGGRFSAGFMASLGSDVAISGGTFGSGFLASDGSAVELIGGEFRLNGVDFTGGTITLADDDVFTGVFADGSPFVFRESDGDTFSEVTLTVTQLPPIDLNPIVINDLSVSVPSGLRTGQTLTLQSGGSLLDNFTVFDATLNVEAGTLGFGSEVLGSEVNISGGSVGSNFAAQSDSVVNISGGTVGSSFGAFSGSEINISGGSVGSNFDANSGSRVNISGGILGSSFEAQSGSEVNISGGAFGSGFRSDSGGDVELIGGEFRLNGADFLAGTISLTSDDVFTGTLADGSSFIFSSNTDRLSNVTLTASELPTANVSPIVIATPVVSGPSGLRAGQSLTVVDGGSLRDGFAVVDATLKIEAGGRVGGSLDASNSEVNISGGTVQSNLSVFGSVVNIDGGEIRSSFNAFGSVLNISDGNLGSVLSVSDSEVNISGGIGARFLTASSGSVVNISDGGGPDGFGGSGFTALLGSEVNISGGRVSADTFGDLEARDGSVVNISGGTIGGGSFFRLEALSGSEVSISGGEVIGSFVADSGSQVSIVGSDFILDGQSLDVGSTTNAPLMILDRDVTLSGLLADGTPFSFDLNSSTVSSDDDFFDADAMLTVALFSDALLGDCDQDGEVTFADIASFIEVLTSGIFLEEADCDQDGAVTFSDIPVFIAILTNT